MDLVTARYRHARRRAQSGVRDDAYVLGGGLNLVDAPLAMDPGQLIACQNYEPGPDGRGYRRVKGFERYASTVPSAAVYTILPYRRATRIPQSAEDVSEAADLITGATSGAAGICIGVEQTTPITTINLLRRSEELENNGVWTHSDVTVDANSVDNPLDGEENAEVIFETTANTEHMIRQAVTKDSTARMYWFSAYVRGHGGLAEAAIRAFFNISKAEVKFDFSSMTAEAVTQNGDFVGLEEYMERIGDEGWWRIGVKFISSVQTTVNCAVLCASPGGILSYAGSTDRGLGAFGFQLEETDASSVAPSAYVPTDNLVRGNGEGNYALLHLLGMDSDFVEGERLQVSGVDQSESDGTTTENGALTDELHKLYSGLAAEVQRTVIEKVPGSGPIRGVALYKGVAYALRDNVAGTAGALWWLNPATDGWSEVPINRKLRFHSGLPAGIVEGNTINGGTSMASAVVRRIVVVDGDFSSSDAVGIILLGDQTGSFQAGEAINVGGTQRATTVAADSAQTIAPGGRLETRVHNFFGHSSTERLYGVDGVNHAFEYQDDPQFFYQIETGMNDDKPKHLAIHDEQLWLLFSGGSLQKSSVGDPALWQVSLGAAEMAIGAEGTGLLEEIGETLFVFTRNKTKYVTGDVANGYKLKDFSPDTGAHEWSIQRIGKGIYLDDRGFTSLAATERFGNYAANSFSSHVNPLVNDLRDQGVVASCVVKDKNLYRCFFADGRFISIGVSGSKITGITNGDLGKVIHCVDSGENLEGKEVIIFGSDDGYVYRMESGKNFDGEPITAFFRTAFHFSKSPNRRKHYRTAQLQVDNEGPCSIKVGTDYSFANPNEAAERIRNIALVGGSGLWNVARWNEFRWSTGVVTEASIKLDADGSNISFLVSHTADDEDEHAVTGVVLSLSGRRRQRSGVHG